MRTGPQLCVRLVEPGGEGRAARAKDSTRAVSDHGTRGSS